MTTIFITGDRSLPNSLAFKLVQAVMVKIVTENQEDLVNNTLRFATGNAQNGIERAVRFIIPEQFLTVIERVHTPEGHIDWDASALYASKIAEKAVVIHMDPMNSRVTKAVLQNFKDVDMPLESLVQTPDTAPAQDSPVELSKEESSEFEALIASLDFGTDEKKSE